METGLSETQRGAPRPLATRTPLGPHRRHQNGRQRLAALGDVVVPARQQRRRRGAPVAPRLALAARGLRRDDRAPAPTTRSTTTIWRASVFSCPIPRSPEENAHQEILYEEYHPHGTSAYRSSNGSVDVSARRYRYTGKERDEETGLYYNGARYLAAWLGRWTSADPVGIGADGPGLYNYTRGSPVKYTDPSGHQGLPTFRIRPPRIQDTWVGKLFTAAAEGAEEIHEDKQANIERGTAQIEAESSASGGDTSEAVTGLKLFLMRRGNDIIYYPGTFYEMVAGTKASHEKGGVSQVALDVVSAPKKELDQAVDAAHTGDWRSLVEHGLNFTADVVSSVLGARAGAAAGPSLPTRSMALAGGGVLSGVGVGEAVAMTGSTLGGLGAGLLAASTGDPPGGAGGGGSDTPAAAPAEAPPAANPHRVFSGYKQIPGLPSSFKNAVDGVVKVAVNNAEKLESLRSVKPGEWKKVYRDIIGPGGRASVHYFEHSSGTIADPSMRVGWSNKSSKVPK